LKAIPEQIPRRPTANAGTNQVPVRLSARAYNGQSRCQAAASRETVFLSDVAGKYLALDG
jgi:hypothetical protein